jgi:hypothetical protein
LEAIVRRTLGIVVLIGLFAAPVVAQQVYVDYDRDYVNKVYKTFAWAPTPETSLAEEHPLMHSRIKNAIEYYVTKGGAVEDRDDPDCYITYHTNTSEEVRYDTTNYGYGYGPGWGWDPYWGGGMSTSTTTARTYERGTLVVDIWDAEDKKMVWRGSATAIVPENPEKATKLIDKMLKKMIKKYDKLRAKD